MKEKQLQIYQYPFSPYSFYLNNNLKMSYVDEGEGDPILMLHGNPTWSYFYRKLISEFSENNRVIAPDHIGCGLSDKPQDYLYILQNHISNLEKLVDHLELKNITLVVHDWGGAIGFGFATKHPQLIKKIVILNTAAYTSSFIAPAINICRTPFLGEQLIRRFNAFAWPATFMAVTKKLPKRVKQGYLLPYNNYKNRVATAKFVADIPMNKKHRSYAILKSIEKRLSDLNCPVLILWGGKDFCFTDYFLKRWQNIFPDAKTKVFPEAGHYLVEDASSEVIREMRQFL